MRTRIVPSSELSSKTLLARHYVPKPEKEAIYSLKTDTLRAINRLLKPHGVRVRALRCDESELRGLARLSVERLS